MEHIFVHINDFDLLHSHPSQQIFFKDRGPIIQSLLCAAFLIFLFVLFFFFLEGWGERWAIGGDGMFLQGSFDDKLSLCCICEELRKTYILARRVDKCVVSSKEVIVLYPQCKCW